MSGGWVLIVEDDSGLARTILQVLRLEGVADAQHAVNVPAALALASRPGLVGALVDVWLPGGHGNGVALATKLRDLHPAADIVVWSGADDMALVREAHQARFDFLTKDAGAELNDDAIDELPITRSYYGTYLQFGSGREWVSDLYSATYYADPLSAFPDPQGPEPRPGLIDHVVRGTTPHADADSETLAQRVAGAPGELFGYRCARSVEVTP